MAAPAAAIAAKIGIGIATDKDARKIAVYIVAVLVALIIVPVLLMGSMLKVAAETDFRSFIAPENGTGAGDVHALIRQLVDGDDTVYTDGPFSVPFRVDDYKALITSGFGWREDPVGGGLAFHSGLDFGVSTGTPVYPVKPGKVIIAERTEGGYGNYIAISHGNGLASLYAHMSALNVSVGQVVDTDTVIGWSGNSGKSTGPHLHLEIIKDGAPQNPRWYLQ